MRSVGDPSGPRRDVGRGLGLRVALGGGLLLAAAAALWVSGAFVARSPDEGPSTLPSAAGPPSTEGARVPPAPLRGNRIRPGDATLVVEAGLKAKVERVRQALQGDDAEAVAAAMAAITKDVCTHPERADGYLRLALLVPEDATSGPGTAHLILGALGRCGHREVLTALIGLLEATTTPRHLVVAVVMALAQRRDAAPQPLEGTGFRWGQLTIDAPTHEAYVVEALLRALRQESGLPGTPGGRPAGRDVLTALCFALGATAGADAAVLDALVQLSRSAPALEPSVLAGLTLSGRHPAVMQHARQRLAAGDLSPAALGFVAALLAREAPRDLLDALLGELTSTTSRAQRVLELLDGASGVRQVRDQDVPLLEQTVAAALSWGREHPTVRPDGRPGSAEAPLRSAEAPRATAAEVAGFVRAAVRVAKGRSRMLVPAYAEAVIALVARGTASRRVLAEWLAEGVAAGGEGFVQALLDGPPSGPGAPADVAAELILALRAAMDEEAWERSQPSVQAALRRMPAEVRRRTEAALPSDR